MASVTNFNNYYPGSIIIAVLRPRSSIQYSYYSLLGYSGYNFCNLLTNSDGIWSVESCGTVQFLQMNQLFATCVIYSGVLLIFSCRRFIFNCLPIFSLFNQRSFSLNFNNLPSEIICVWGELPITIMSWCVGTKLQKPDLFQILSWSVGPIALVSWDILVGSMLYNGCRIVVSAICLFCCLTFVAAFREWFGSCCLRPWV